MLAKNVVSRYPTIYHMAEAGTWESIRERGLMSTTAVLDHLGIQGVDRAPFETLHRAAMARVGENAGIVLRDQIPMPPQRLEQALVDGTTPEQWYRLINGKVFFWAQEHRMHRLLNYYGDTEHDVLHVDTKSLLADHANDVWLCHMNSGNTLPIPHHRGIDVFKRIDAYPETRTGRPAKEVVEIVVDYAVPNIAAHVVRVYRMRGSAQQSLIWER
ncbi:DUF7002 family protein [Novilysobacter spongiicola]|uniref:Uncharacterized protein n=1 Tax=Lysobacter spongiicola DSM 21749 TaxID=1122188 RepID=A0A1T4RZF7_9GAMM|nr:hypothetical protein [Lysobacter spongiicola]SKA21088.1 hypothetical protein SAMN02745674_02447 [Lysobacter spongiicola DSM 21749]